MADQLIFNPDTPNSLKTNLEGIARVRPETPDRQLAAYDNIYQNLQKYLDGGQIWQDEIPGIYVYEVIHKTYRQTGIWALTSLADNIKVHEDTLKDSTRRLKNYREHTGLEGSPILLTYAPDVSVNRIIAQTRTALKPTIFGNSQCIHKLWKIEDEDMLQQLIHAFARIEPAYLADGHHRLSSASMLADEQRCEKTTVYDSITALYIATDQLYIREYDRVLFPEETVDKEWLFGKLAKNFYIRESTGNKPIRPVEAHKMGMLVDGEWYHLSPKIITAQIDADMLQDQLLRPVLGINNPANDNRLKYIGGINAMQEILHVTETNPRAIAFTLCAVTIEQLMAVANAGQILPPKATWIDPKIPYGLLMYKH